MKRRSLLWSRAALAELDHTIAYIAADNPAAARKVFTKIRKTTEGLRLAATGRRGRVSGTYEKVVVGLPYIIAYALSPQPVGSEQVVILHVIHMARDWPGGERDT